MAGDSPYKQIVGRSTRYFDTVGLKPFLLCLPLQGNNASSNQAGIRDKILKNNSLLRSCLYTKYQSIKKNQNQNHNYIDSEDKCEKDKDPTMTKLDQNSAECKETIETRKESDEQPQLSTFSSLSLCPESSNIDTYKCLRFIHNMVDNLTNPDIYGFVLVITEVVPEQEFRPVAGGIVELLDEHERAIRGLWCRWSLPEVLSNELVKLTCMLLLAHAFEWSFPGRRNRSTNKLVSILDQTCLSFPKEANKFLLESISMSKHWETQTDAGNHNDHPSCKCKCYKIAEKPEAWMFWGISESRFIKQWKSYDLSQMIPDTCHADFTCYFTIPQNVKTAPENALKHESDSKDFIVEDGMTRSNKRISSPNSSDEKSNVKRKALAA